MARILLLSHDVVGAKMAGPAIRYWELAQELGRRHDVTLAVPLPTDLDGGAVRIVTWSRRSPFDLLRDQDVLIAQLISPPFAVAARRLGVRTIADFYDPILLEDLEFNATASPLRRRARNQRMLATTRHTLASADAIVCASDRQRDLWMGSLLAMDRLRPDVYDRDVSMRSLVDLVPFGMPREDPIRTGPGLRSTLDIPASDTVLLWGGGVWDWFDPLTLITALAKALTTDPTLHLVFMGLRHPNDRVPASAMAAKALDLASSLGLLDTHVHANAGWVPYADRQNLLLDADIGVSTHFDHLETRFSFRTRILDYLWAGLPLLVTEGDSFGDLVAQRGLGIAVPPRDVDALSDAILRLAGDSDLRSSARAAVMEARSEFTWERAAQPLDRIISTLLDTPGRRRLALAATRQLAVASARDVVVGRRGRQLAARVLRRLRARRS